MSDNEFMYTPKEIHGFRIISQEKFSRKVPYDTVVQIVIGNKIFYHVCQYGFDSYVISLD